jgi:hypothetical protein
MSTAIHYAWRNISLCALLAFSNISQQWKRIFQKVLPGEDYSFISFTRNISFNRRERCRICFKKTGMAERKREYKSAAVDRKLHSEWVSQSNVISKFGPVHTIKAYRGADLELHSFLTLLIYVVKLDLKERNNLGFISVEMAILNLKNGI